MENTRATPSQLQGKLGSNGAGETGVASKSNLDNIVGSLWQARQESSGSSMGNQVRLECSMETNPLIADFAENEIIIPRETINPSNIRGKTIGFCCSQQKNFFCLVG